MVNLPGSLCNSLINSIILELYNTETIPVWAYTYFVLKKTETTK